MSDKSHSPYRIPDAMSRQREHTPPRRRKPQARNTRVKPSSPQPLPGWLWMAGGILIGALVTAIINFGGDNKKAEADAELAATEAREAAPTDEPRSSPSHKPRFDFYTLLKENEVLVPDEDGNLPVSKAVVIAEQQTPPAEEQPKSPSAELVATASKQEPTVRRQEQKPTEPPQQEAARAIAPEPVKEASPIVAQRLPPASDPTPAPQSVKAPEPPAPAPAPSEVYLLQAGSFRNAADADNVRASLLLLNMHASIEKVTTGPNEVWHRVIVGPFSNTSDLGNARALLSQNGIDSIQVKKQR